jgi:hypothetical protein
MIKGQKGDAKIWIVLIVIIVAISLYLVIKLKPVYSAKWDFEKYVEEQIRRLYVLGEDGIFELADEYAQEHNMPVRPYEDCTLSVEFAQEGRMVCNYKEEIHFPGNYTYVMPIRAEAFVPRVPTTSN